MLRKLHKVLWAALLACAFVAFNADEASAETALASWYGPGFHGNPTASGEIYNAYGYTAAHKTLPLGTQLVVSYNGVSVPVTVNDRGPYVGARELDLSQGAAEAIGLTQAGVGYVDYQVVSYGDNAYTPPESSAPAPAYAAEPASTGYAGATGGTTTHGGVYTVQPGDTLSELAMRLGTTVEALAAANGIADPDLILAGQTLDY